MEIQDYILETPDKMNKIIELAEELFSKIVKLDFDKIIITGSGTSYHSGVQIQGYIQNLINVEVITMYPFMINKDIFKGENNNTLVIGISQGGSSYSTYNALKLAKENGCITASMAGCENALIDEVSDYILTVYCGEEDAGAKTKGYFCTKLNLMLLGLNLAKEKGEISELRYENEINKIKDSSNRFNLVFNEAEKWITCNKERLIKAKDIRIIGPSELYGDTLESALKLLETMRIPVTGYEFEEFIHGIYNAINEDSTIIIFDTGKEPRVRKMIEVLSGWTDNLYVIGRDVDNNEKNIRISASEDKYYQTFNYIIPIQLICALIPKLKGINPEIPKDPKFHMKLESKKI